MNLYVGTGNRYDQSIVNIDTAFDKLETELVEQLETNKLDNAMSVLA